MFAKTRILSASVLASLALVACGPANTPVAGTAKNVAATVNGEPISESTLEMAMKRRGSTGAQIDAAARKAVIDRLAVEMLIAQEAVKKGLDKSPQVEEQLKLTRQNVLIAAYIHDYMENTKISDEALKAEYEKLKAQEGGTEYRARHILVPTEAEANKIIAKLKKNPDEFGSIAQKESQDPGSKSKGGELGWFETQRMVPEFGAAVSKLAKGQITETPVKTQFGYHVIQVEDSRAKQFPPLDQIKQELTQKVLQDQVRERIEALRAKAEIEIMPVKEAAPAAQAPAPAK